MCSNIHTNNKIDFVASAFTGDKIDPGSLRQWLKGDTLKSKTQARI